MMKIYLKTFAASLVFLLFSGLNVFGQIPNYVSSNGLVGWWPFNGNANDESGNGNNGTVNGSILVSDRFGNTNSAYFFDNGSDLICTSNSFASPNSLSYSVWIKSVNPGFLLGFNNGQCAHGGQWDRTIIVDDNSQLRYYTFNGTQVFNTASTNVIDDTWKHLVVTMDQNGSKIYVNGIFISSNSSQTVGENTSGWFRFGGLSPNDANNSMIGNYDDIGIWNRALTVCEIQDLYNSQLNSFSINGGSDQTVCFGESVTLTALGGTTYSWNNSIQDGVSFVPTGNQTYTVTSTSASGCVATDQVIVTVNPLPTINTGPDIEVCDGSQLTLTATGGDNYSWTNGVMNGVAFTEQGTQTYTVTGTDVNNCSNTDQVTVTVNPTPDISVSNDSICQGENTSLSVSLPLISLDTIIKPGNQSIPIIGSAFEYSSTAPPSGWQTNYGNWQAGNLPFIGINTGSIPNSTHWPIGTTYYLRKQIDLTNYDLNTINWYVAVDNGYTLYVNGQQIASAYEGGPATEWEYSGLIPSNLLVQGINTVALIISDDGSGAAVFNMLMTGTLQIPTILWSPGGATTPSITVSPTQTTTYTWDVTSNGLTCSNEVIVTVLQPTTSNIQPIACSSYTAPDGAVYSSSGIYQAIIPNTEGCDSTITIDLTVNNPTSSIIAPIVCSSYTAPDGAIYISNGTYQAVIPNSNGCDSTITIYLMVHPLPTVGAGNDFSVCEGEQITLSGSGASSYTWNNGISDGVPFTEQGTMTYTITGTDNNNCSNTDQVTVTVNPLPVINAGVDLTVCEGDPVSLTASGGVAYTWDNDVINSLPFTPTHIGDLTYTVTGTSLFGCLNADQVVVTVNEHSVASQTATGLDSYTWPVNGQTYTESGSYAAIIPNEAGCDSTITLDLTLAYTGIEDLEPNTTKKLLKITDLNGKETPFRKNTVMLFIYEDGTVERVYEAE